MAKALLLMLCVTLLCPEGGSTDTTSCPGGCSCSRPDPHTIFITVESRPDESLTSIPVAKDKTISVIHVYDNQSSSWWALGDYLCNFPNLESFSWNYIGGKVEETSLLSSFERGRNFSWSCLPHLRVIKVQGGDLVSELQMRLLAGLQDLTELHLVGNAIAACNETLLAQWPNLQLIDLARNRLLAFPDMRFENGSKIKHINVSDNEIKDLPMDILSPLRSLESINMAGNMLTNLSFLAVAPDTLMSLDLSRNQIRGIPGNVFPHLINLRQLDLAHNNISELDWDAFGCRLGKLENLRLKHNDLMTLPHHVFAGFDKLLMLDLSHNRLSKLHHEMFTSNNTSFSCADDMHKDTSHENVVDIGYKTISMDPVTKDEDEITKVASEDKSSAKSAKNKYDSHRNSISVDNNRPWQHFVTLDVSFNRITSLSSDCFAHQLAFVHNIDLSHNELVHVPRLEHLLFLEKVNLSHNLINWLDVGVFNNPKLSIIDLSNNRLTKIISMAFLYLPAMSFLDLSNNQINYIYKMAFYRTCKHGQAMVVDMQGNHLQNDAILKLVNCFKHLQDTPCTVAIDLQRNAMTHFLQQPTIRLHLNLRAQEARYFNTWDHVSFDVDYNRFNCDCQLVSDINIFVEMHDLFYADFLHPEYLRFWQNATCSLPSSLKGTDVADFYHERSPHCRKEYGCPEGCDCIPYVDHIFINCSYRHLNHPPSSLPPGPKVMHLQGNHFSHLNHLSAQYKHVQAINLSHCHIETISPSAWKVLSKIHSVSLHGNQLSALPVDVPCLGELSLSHNPLDCSCVNANLIKWLLNCSDTLTDFDNIRCVDGTFFLDLYGEPCEPSTPFMASLMLTMISMCITFLLGVIIIFAVYHYRTSIVNCLMRKQKWYKVHADEYLRYDILILYCKDDADTVNFGILPILHHSGQYTSLCLQQRDWHADNSVAENFTPSVQNSSAVVIVASAKFMASEMQNPIYARCVTDLLSSGSTPVCIVSLDTAAANALPREGHAEINFQSEDFRCKLLASLPSTTVPTNSSNSAQSDHASSGLIENEKY